MISQPPGFGYVGSLAFTKTCPRRRGGHVCCAGRENREGKEGQCQEQKGEERGVDRQQEGYDPSQLHYYLFENNFQQVSGAQFTHQNKKRTEADVFQRLGHNNSGKFAVRSNGRSGFGEAALSCMGSIIFYKSLPPLWALLFSCSLWDISKDFPGGSVVKNFNTGDAVSVLGSERSPGVGNDNPLQYSCLGNCIDRGTWPAAVHGVAKSWTRLCD